MEAREREREIMKQGFRAQHTVYTEWRATVAAQSMHIKSFGLATANKAPHADRPII